MKRIAKYTAVVLITLLGLLILWQFRSIILIVLMSVMVAAVLRPFIEWLTRRGLPRAAAFLIVYGVIIGVGVGIVFALGEAFLAEINNLVNHAVVEYDVLYRNWEQGSTWQQAVIGMLPQPITAVTAEPDQLGDLLPVAMAMTQGLMGLLAGLALLLSISVYWGIDQTRFERLWLSLLPPTRRTLARNSWRGAEAAVGRYLIGQLAQSFLVALFLGAGAALAGLEYPLLLALFGAFAAFVPFIGGLATALVAFLMGSLVSPWLGLGLAAVTLALFWAVDHWVDRAIWKEERRTSLLAILLVIPMFEALGLIGLVLAVPLAAALEVIVWQAYRSYLLNRDKAIHLADLDARYRRLADRLAQAEQGEVTPELVDMTQRLETLLASSQAVD